MLFSDERKPVLDAIRDELRNHDYLPIMFDFLPSPNQATLETIKTLASMTRFVVADLTDARSVLMELGAIVPAFPKVAVRLMIKKSEHEYGMLDSIRCYRSVVENTNAYADSVRPHIAESVAEALLLSIMSFGKRRKRSRTRPLIDAVKLFACVRGHCFLELRFDSLHVEARTLLHRRELDQSLGSLRYLLLREDEAPKLVSKPVVVGNRPIVLTVIHTSSLIWVQTEIN